TLFTRIEGIVIPDMISSHIKYYITVIDTTESRKAQQLLKETNERLEMILKASSTGIWGIEFGNKNIKLDESNYKVRLDENCYKILNLDPWEFGGSLKDFFLLIHPSDQEKVRYSYMYSLNNST